MKNAIAGPRVNRTGRQAGQAGRVPGRAVSARGRGLQGAFLDKLVMLDVRDLCGLADYAEDLAPDLPGDVVRLQQVRRIVAAIARMPADRARYLLSMVG